MLKMDFLLLVTNTVFVLEMAHSSLIIILLILMILQSFVVLELYLRKSTLVIVEQFFCHCQMLHDMTKMVLWSEERVGRSDFVPKAKRKNSRLGSRESVKIPLGYETNFWSRHAPQPPSGQMTKTCQ